MWWKGLWVIGLQENAQQRNKYNKMYYIFSNDNYDAK